VKDILNNESINTVAIVTRHDAHASQVIDALNAGKHVFVEKPLALTLDEIEQIDKAYQKANMSNEVKLMVGFNRRYAPHIVKMKELLSSHRSPKSIIMTINAGPISVEHWVQDALVGGGRIVGEGCHFIDLMRHLVGHSIIDFTATMMGSVPGVEVREDKASITLSFSDGSFGTILYLANGGSAFPKERIEVFCDDAVLQMDNYRVLTGYGWSGFKKMRLFKQDKGQKDCVQSFVNSIIEGKDAPIPYVETIESSRVSIEVANTLRG
jgi:predicted dehydrogenase